MKEKTHVDVRIDNEMKYDLTCEGCGKPIRINQKVAILGAGSYRHDTTKCKRLYSKHRNFKHSNKGVYIHGMYPITHESYTRM